MGETIKLNKNKDYPIEGILQKGETIKLNKNKDHPIETKHETKCLLYYIQLKMLQRSPKIWDKLTRLVGTSHDSLGPLT